MQFTYRKNPGRGSKNVKRDDFRDFFGAPDPTKQKHVLPGEPAYYPLDQVVNLDTRKRTHIEDLERIDGEYAAYLNALFEDERYVKHAEAASERKFPNPLRDQDAFVSAIGEERTAQLIIANTVEHSKRLDKAPSFHKRSMWTASQLYRAMGLPTAWDPDKLGSHRHDPYKRSLLSRTIPEVGSAGLGLNPLHGLVDDMHRASRELSTNHDLNYNCVTSDLAAGLDAGRDRDILAFQSTIPFTGAEQIGSPRASHTIPHWAPWDILRVPNCSAFSSPYALSCEVTESRTTLMPLRTRTRRIMDEYGFKRPYHDGAPTMLQEVRYPGLIWACQTSDYQKFVEALVIDFFDQRPYRGSRAQRLSNILRSNVILSFSELHAHFNLVVTTLLKDGFKPAVMPGVDFEIPGVVEAATLWHLRWFAHRMFNTYVDNQQPFYAMYMAGHFFAHFTPETRLSLKFGA